MDPSAAGGVEWREDALGLLGDPTADRRVIGSERRGEQSLEEVFDLTQADPGREADGGHLLELGTIAEDGLFALSAQRDDLIAKPPILGVELVQFGPTVVGVEPSFDPASVLVDRLAAAPARSAWRVTAP